MALLNYTTTIDVARTIGEIHGMLVRAGARSIVTDYDDAKQPVSIAFLVTTPLGDREFVLPANVDAVHKTLTRQYQQRKVAARFVSKEQAHRVGWRIVKDWVEAQLAIIESGMVSLDMVMLPYMTLATGQFYDVFVRQQLALPAAKDTA